MKRKYFLMDLDGTLLRNDSSISDYTIKTLKHTIDQGAVISYATARSYTSSQSVTSMIPWKYPLVVYNGGLIIDPINKEVLAGSWLKEDVTNAIIEEGKKLNLRPLLFCLDKSNKEHVFHEQVLNEAYVQFIKERKDDPRFKEVENLYCPDEYKTMYITYIGSKGELDPLKTNLETMFKDKIAIHYIKYNKVEDQYFLEFTNPKSNKEEGLVEWSKLVGCEPDQVTVFGDNLNDIGLFARAGKKIAVKNANSVIIEKADEVIGSNEEDGVAKYIYGEIRE